MPKIKWETLTLFEKAEILRALSLYPAITVMVFIRYKIGFRMMKPIWLFIMTGFMLIIPVFFESFLKPFAFLMPLYALAMLGTGLFQRRQRWIGLHKNERWHTYSAGISYLDKLPLPDYFQAHYRIHRFLDPLAVFLVGLIIGYLLSHGLGVWIMFSAFFLYVHEQNVYEIDLKRDLDTYDGLIASKHHQQLVEALESGPSDPQQSDHIQPVGIASGLDPELSRRVLTMQAEAEKESDNPADAPGLSP